MNRMYPQFSACGLNCGLCPRYHTDGSSRCPGCGGEGFFEKRPSCSVLSCNKRHGEIEFCYLCEEYPCEKLAGTELCDSFITHRNMKRDFQRAKTEGIDSYLEELDEKMAILDELLSEFNDGRKKSFYCLAVNLLELSDLKTAMKKIRGEIDADQLLKEKAAKATAILKEIAEEKNTSLILSKKEATK